MILMPHIYEFSIDGRPVARMNFPSLLKEKDIVGIRLMLAHKHQEDIDCVTHQYEFCNLVQD